MKPFMLQRFCDKNIMLIREKKQYQINLGKTCYMTENHSAKAKFKILKGLKG